MSSVWIVDDDEEMSLAISLFLRLMGCEILTFHSARAAARDLMEGRRPDLLLLDINMPEVSGLDLLEFIRRRSAWDSLPILMLSSEAADATVDQALETGADGYLTKPVTFEELETAMRRALSKHQKGLQTNVQE